MATTWSTQWAKGLLNTNPRDPNPPAAPSSIDGLIVFAGQSNSVGQGNSNNLDNGLTGGLTGWGIGGTIPTDSRIQLAHHCAPGVADPPVFTDVPGAPPPYFRDLQQYAAAGGAGFGAEISFGRYLADTSAMTAPIYIGKYAIGGIDIARFLPGSGYPTAGPDLYTLFTGYIDTLIAQSGKQLACIVWVQGESDADTDAESTGYQAKLTTFVNALRTKYGNTFIFCISRLSDNQIGGFSASMTTTRVNNVQAAQDAVAAASPSNTIVVNTNGVPTVSTGKEHYTADGYWMLGNRLASAVLAKVNPSQSDNQGSGASPYIQWIREPSNGNDSSNGDIIIYPQTNVKAGDLELLLGGHASSTTQNALVALTTANGFATTGHATAQSIFGGSTIVSAALFSRTGTGSTPLTATMTDLVTRKRGLTLSVRNTSGIGAQAITADNLNNVTHTLNGVTTTVNNSRVVWAVFYFSGSAANVTAFAPNGGSMTGTVIHRNSYRNHNGSSSQDACKIAIMSSVLPTAGATGTATITCSAATVAAAICFELKP